MISGACLFYCNFCPSFLQVEPYGHRRLFALERGFVKKILIVEDEEDLVKLLTLQLKNAGYDVVSAKDGQEGLEKVRAEMPDLVLLDVMMPKIDGFQVCRLLKFDNQFKHIPIIMLTARGLPKDEKTGAEVGADRYMVKPFEGKKLLKTIEELLS